MKEMMLKKRRSTKYLPEIVSRVLLTSLARLRWNALMKDNILAKEPSHILALIDSRVYVASVDIHKINNNKVKLTSQFSLKGIENVFHCDGLLLCRTRDNSLVVWNPCSRETRWIQPRIAYKRLDYFALGKSSSNKYKILKIDQFGIVNPVLRFDIYDFTSNSWRYVGETRDWFIRLPYKGRGMSVNGNTYWHVGSQENGSDKDFIQSFDYSTERFTSVSLPGDCHSDQVCSLSVTSQEQKLCFLTMDERVSRINVWIATKIESNGAASWIKFLSVDLASIHQPFFVCHAMNFLVDQENKVLVCCGKRGVSNKFLHVLGENKSIQVDAKSECSLLVNYVPTLVQIQ